MLSLTILFTSLVAGFAAAQNSSMLDPNSVDSTSKSQWCQGERNNCPLLCGGPMSTKSNECDGMKLTYTCLCANGSEPANIADYLDTLPNHICQRQFENCRQANPGSQSCKTCGTLKATDVPMAAATSAAASGSASASAMETGAAPAATTSALAGGAAGRFEGVVGGMAAAGVIAAGVAVLL